MINTTFFATLVYLKQPCAAILGVPVEKENLPTWDLGPGTWDLGPGTWEMLIKEKPGTWDLGPGTWDLGPGRC